MSPLVIVTYVFLFILKLRFPKSTPLTTTIVNRYGYPTLALFRKLENFLFKVEKTNLDIEFLQACKTRGIIPKFLFFKVYNHKVTRTLTYKQFQHKLLNYELNGKK